MRYNKLGRTGLVVSRIGLGTAEIGFNYGIGSRPVPSEAEAIALLRKAVDCGINFFDTATIHQLSDERIAKSGITQQPYVIIATKCGHFLEKGEDPPRLDLERCIRQEVETSLSRLKLETIPILQLHGGSKEQIERGDVVEILLKLKEEGKAKFIGISTRGVEAPLAAIACQAFDVIQVAYSILDQRMASQVLPVAQAQNIGVINRSVMLKGALTPLAKQLPIKLAALKVNVAKAKKIANDLGVCLPTLAIRYALANTAISTVLIGTNKRQHLLSGIGTQYAKPLINNVIEALNGLAINDPDQVDPARWPRLSN